MTNLRKIVFWPAAIGIVLTIIISMTVSKGFVTIVNACNGFITNNLAWLFNGTATIMVLICAYAMLSPLGSVKIGGPDAEPILPRFKWFAVSLTTVIAMGIVFWPLAEAIMHFTSPAATSGIEASTPAAAKNAMAILYVHWTVTPYAIYSVLALTFALSFYNLKMPFSISTIVRPLLGNSADGKAGEVVDALGTAAVILGMSATLVSAVMAIADGITSVSGFITKDNTAIYALIAFGMMALAIVTAASGVQKGIQILARINTIMFFVALAFFFGWGSIASSINSISMSLGGGQIFGDSATHFVPAAYFLNLGVESFGLFVDEFFQRNLITGAAGNDPWAGYWTVAYFGSWFAWAPITCLFLGRISRGYTVREMLMMNLLLPSFFGWFWFSVFGGTGIFMETAAPGTFSVPLKETGFGSLIYILFGMYPLPFLTKCLYIAICVISYVTAANANLDAIGALCTKGITADKVQSPIWLKLFWGSAIAFVGFLGMSLMGLDGIRALFNLSGLPGLIIAIGGCAAFIKTAYIIQNGLTDDFVMGRLNKKAQKALVKAFKPQMDES